MSPGWALALAASLAAAGYGLRWLTAGGAGAATLVGGAVFMGAGWAGASWLALFFVSSSLLGDRPLDPPAAAPRRRGRTWRQVAANGFWAAVGALLAHAGWDGGWALAAGALAAATADTWATELGTRAGGEPVLVTTGRRVVRGASGGVTWMGSAAGVAGAGVLATLVWVGRGDLGFGIAAWAGGVGGMLVDSVLGATVQGVYRCADCDRETEMPSRHNGHSIQRVRGVRWLDNDVVNALATGAGGLGAVLFASGP